MARFLTEALDRDLTTDEVFLYQRQWSGGSRRDVDTTPRDFTGSSQPIVAANMNAVTGSRMAEAMARAGGLAILPQDIPGDKLTKIVAKIKSADPRCDTALTVRADDQVNVVVSLMYKRAANMVIVVDAEGRPIGVLRPRDIKGVDMFTLAHRLMTSQVVTVPYAAPIEQQYELLVGARVDAAPVVDDQGVLRGVISQRDLEARAFVTPSIDRSGCLMVGLAIGINGDPAKKAAEALAMGVDVLVLDTAHGYQVKMAETARAVRDAAGPSAVLVAGNVCTGDGAEFLFNAGANIAKVGVGPGGACITRMRTAVGRPQFSAVLDCAAVAETHGKHVWADGGVRNPRDLCLYLAAGASRVMIGTMLAGTFESPGDVQINGDGRMFKHHWGMASSRAVAERNGGVSAYELAIRRKFEEGVSDSMAYLKPGLDSVVALVDTFVTGLRSSMTYVGAENLKEYTQRALFGVQSLAGYHEGTPHGHVSK